MANSPEEIAARLRENKLNEIDELERKARELEKKLAETIGGNAKIEEELENLRNIVEEKKREFGLNLPAKQPGKLQRMFKKIAVGLGLAGLFGAIVVKGKDDNKDEPIKTNDVLESETTTKVKETTTKEKATTEKVTEEQTEEQTEIVVETSNIDADDIANQVDKYYESQPSMEYVIPDLTINNEVGQSYTETNTEKIDFVAESNTTQKEKPTEAKKEENTNDKKKKPNKGEINTEKEEKTTKETETLEVVTGENGETEKIIVDSDATIPADEIESEEPETIIDDENPFSDLDSYVVTPEETAEKLKEELEETSFEEITQALNEKLEEETQKEIENEER